MTETVTLENYEQLRQELVEQNGNLLGVVLREREVELDRRLAALKREFRESCGGAVAYDIPVLTDPRLRESGLYRFCDAMPKGGDLHVHDMALLPAEELIPLLADCPEFCINTDRQHYDLRSVPPDEPAPAGYRRFAEALADGTVTREELITHWTVAGAADSGMNIWDYFETLFDRQGCLSGNVPFAAKYYAYTFRYYCRHHIQHVEIHIMLTDGIDDSLEYLTAVRQAYYEVKKEYPYFTLRIIGAGVKADNATIDLTRKCFLNASYVQEVLKDESDPDDPADLVIGFDLVNEEDSSLPLRAFAPMLLKVRRQYPSMKLYIHGGESLDAGNENLIDAYLLGVSRVGHGLNLYRYPDLHARFVQAEICLEVCPISNQTLGYTRDIRNHPATEYLRTGVPIALCSDDAAYMEHTTLTDDFFAATVGWDLGVAELKQLGLNSILYSGLTDHAKYAALAAYHRLWDEFTAQMLGESEGEESV